MRDVFVCLESAGYSFTKSGPGWAHLELDDAHPCPPCLINGAQHTAHHREKGHTLARQWSKERAVECRGNGGIITYAQLCSWLGINAHQPGEKTRILTPAERLLHHARLRTIPTVGIEDAPVSIRPWIKLSGEESATVLAWHWHYANGNTHVQPVNSPKDTDRRNTLRDFWKPAGAGGPGVNLWNWRQSKVENPDPTSLYICEGEKDALLMGQFGYQAVALPGALSLNEKQSNTLSETFHYLPRFRLCFDADAAGAQGRINALIKISKTRKTTIEYLRWPAGTEKGADLTDLCKNNKNTPELFPGIIAALDWVDAFAELAAAPVPVIIQDEPRKPEGCTPDQMANRFVRLFGADVRFCVSDGRWYVWDGNIWERDERGHRRNLLRKAIQDLRDQVETITNQDICKAMLKFANKMEAGAPMDDTLRLAGDCRAVQAELSDFNTTKHLLPLADGTTINLRTGERAKGERSAMMARRVSREASKPADGGCPRWEQFIGESMGGDPDLMAYVQRVCGYILTGETREQTFFFVYGPAQAGKGLFTNTLLRLLGTEYADTLNKDAIIEARGGIKPPNDFAGLVATRLVVIPEVNESYRLDENLVKMLTGEDPIRTRFLRAEFFSYWPDFKIIMTANTKPIVKDQSAAYFRRMQLVPFDCPVTDDKRDSRLRDKLLAELPGILEWAVAGALAYYEEGLRPPEQVRLAVERYREESDPLEGFLAACVTRDQKDQHIRTADAHAHYVAWCGGQGIEKPLSRKRFASALKTQLGILGELPKKGDGNDRVFPAIGLRIG